MRTNRKKPLKHGELERIAARIRLHIVESIYKAQSGHVGSSFSCTELLTALYFRTMNLGNPKPTPDVKKRDVFILSKGHAAPALYATFAERGLLNPKLLSTLRQIESPLQGHPERHRLKYVDATTGSLGQGLSMAQGYALSKKRRGAKERVYCLVGDGELQEGQVWEAARSIANNKLDNLVCIVDHNKFQLGGDTNKLMTTKVIERAFDARGWNRLNINGHNFREIDKAFATALHTKNRPTVIIANTVKGEGLSFTRGDVAWHGKVFDATTYEQAKQELSSHIT